jgi:hypothetical protein
VRDKNREAGFSEVIDYSNISPARVDIVNLLRA